MNYLANILENKKIEIEAIKDKYNSKSKIASPFNIRPFRRAIATFDPKRDYSIIAEVKKASPSRGIILPDLDHLEIAKIYEDNGACAISVLTEGRYFHGDIRYLEEIRNITELPLLRKDFIIHESQVYESITRGADAILLIAGVLSNKDMIKRFYETAKDLGMDVVFEVHNKRELEIGLEIGIDIIGINNRDLETFKTNLSVTLELIKDIPEGHTIISESGISNLEQIKMLASNGVDGFLIGESLIKAKDIGKKLRGLAVYRLT